jgi:hypothetical protein
VRVTANAIGWLVIGGCVGIALAFSAAARGDSAPPQLPLAARVAALVPRFGSRKVELVDAQAFGVAIETACNGDRECAAKLVTMAVAESGLSAAVSRSEYRPHEGDAYTNRDGVRVHRAWGTWQGHKNAHNAGVWGSDDLLVQARAARSMQLGALAECRKFRGVDPEVGMWRVLSGHGCLLPYSGEEIRMGLLARVRRAL